MSEIKRGQIWRRKSDGTLVEVRRIETGYTTNVVRDVAYRRVGVKGVGTSQCYEPQFLKRYELVEEVA